MREVWIIFGTTHYVKNVFVSQVENAIIHCFIDNSYITQFIHSYFKTSSSLAVRWGLFSPVLLPGVDSPLELRERPWTLWITEDDPCVAELLCLMFKIPFIASALRFKNNNTNCYFYRNTSWKNWAEKWIQNSDEEGYKNVMTIKSSSNTENCFNLFGNFVLKQGAKKDSFAACHSGKL